MIRLKRKENAGKWSNIAGILAIVWMCIIFAFSAQTKEESSVVSEGFSYRMVSTTGLFFHLNIDEEQLRELANSIEHFVRKGAHMTEYAILAILLFGWLGGWEMRQLCRTCTAMGLASLYACSDEFHQLFVAGRAGQISDVLVDSAGAVFGLALFLVLVKLVKLWRGRKHTSKHKR